MKAFGSCLDNLKDCGAMQSTVDQYMAAIKQSAPSLPGCDLGGGSSSGDGSDSGDTCDFQKCSMNYASAAQVVGADMVNYL